MKSVTQVTVLAQTDGAFRVDVHGQGRMTTHVVTVPADYPTALGCDNVPIETLIAASFRFLLAREPATSILPRFRLDQIAEYFPEFPNEITHRFKDTP
jgi:hypothetical protein